MIHRPIELCAANVFISAYHRHHKPVQGHRFSMQAVKNGRIVGVIVVGRPVARKTCQRTILEVTRLCTDGHKNTCSFLYAAAARAGKAIGYSRIQTFILESESGTSLLAAGWHKGHLSKGGKGWQSRAGRKTCQPTENKILWWRDLTA